MGGLTDRKTIQAALSLLVILTVFVLTLRGDHIPEVIFAALGAIIGFYFGSSGSSNDDRDDRETWG